MTKYPWCWGEAETLVPSCVTGWYGWAWQRKGPRILVLHPSIHASNSPPLSRHIRTSDSNRSGLHSLAMTNTNTAVTIWSGAFRGVREVHPRVNTQVGHTCRKPDTAPWQGPPRAPPRPPVLSTTASNLCLRDTNVCRRHGGDNLVINEHPFARPRSWAHARPRSWGGALRTGAMTSLRTEAMPPVRAHVVPARPRLAPGI